MWDAIPSVADLQCAWQNLLQSAPTLSAAYCDAHDAGIWRAAAAHLDRQGFWWRPSWTELREGKRPPRHDARDPGEWPHGWQYWVSSITDTHFRRISMLTGRAASFRAHLRSHSGLNAGIVLSHAPTAPEYTVPPHLFRVILLERLALPLPVNEARCDGCHEPLDTLGRHLAACPRTGRLRKLASPIERMLARICREAGVRVRFNAFLRDMNVHVRADDERRIEVLAQDLPCFGGAQLAIDVTLRSALRSSGEPQPHAADVDGAILLEAPREKEATYPELASSNRCRLVVVAVETGGR